MEEEIFINKMKEELIKHTPVYGNSWKTMPVGHLENRLKNKVTEYELTGSSSKLISIANLAMLLYKRRTENDK